MFKEKILSIYDSCINNPQILQFGHQFLEDYLKGYEDFAPGSIEIVLDKSLDFQVRKYIGIQDYFIDMHQLIYLRTCQFLIGKFAPKELKQFNSQQMDLFQMLMKEQYLNGLSSSSHKLLKEKKQNLGKTSLNYCYNKCYFCQNSSSNQQQKLLEVLLFLFQQLGDEMSIIASQTLNLLLTLMINNQTDRLTLLHIVYYVIRSFSYTDQTDKKLLSSCFDATFVQWMTIFQEILKSAPNMFLHIKIYAIKCLKLIFSDLKTYSKSQKENIASVLPLFITNLAELFLKVQVENYPLSNIDEKLQPVNPAVKLDQKEKIYIDYYDEQYSSYSEESLVSLLVYNSIELLMNFHLNNDQIYQALIKFCLLTNQESNEYSPFYFLSDFFDDEPSIRKVTLLFFENYLNSNKLKQSVLNFLIQFLQSQENNWLFYEVKYWLIESHSEILIKTFPTLMNDLISIQEKDQNNQGLTKKISLILRDLSNSIYQDTKQNGPLLMSGCQQLLLNANRFTTKLASLRNLAILLSKSTEQEEVVKFLSGQQIFNSIASILSTQEDDLIHISLDSILHIIKYSKQLIPIYGEIVIPIISAKLSKFQHDSLILQIVTEILEAIVSLQQGWEVIYKQFLNASGFIWLTTTRILTKNAPTNQHLELMAQRVPQLLQWMLTNLHDSDQYIQATLLLSTFIKYINSFNENLTSQFTQLISMMLLNYDDEEKQQSTLQIHQLILGFWAKLSSKQFDIQIINKVAFKIVTIDVPSSIEGLAVILSMIIATYPQQSISYLQTLEIQEINKLLNKWLKFSKVFSGKNQLNILCQGLLNILKSKTSKWHDLAFDDGINKPSPLYTKILEILIQFFEAKGSQSMHDIGLFDVQDEEDQGNENNEKDWEEENSQQEEDDQLQFDQDLMVYVPELLSKPTKDIIILELESLDKQFLESIAQFLPKTSISILKDKILRIGK